MKVCLRPQPDGIAGGGVRRRLDALWEHLPKHGVEFVDKPSQADLVHCHAIAQAEGFAHSMVYTNHGVYELTEDSPQHEWVMNGIIVRNLRLARRVISVARWPLGIYSEDLGVNPAVIPNGVDLSQWEAVPRGEFIKRHRIGKPFFLWAKISDVGVSDPTPVLELARRLPDYAFVTTFAPHGAERPPNLKIVGSLPFEEMQRALADCAVYLATTKENFSVQIIEAMALEKPILGYDWGGTAEAVRHGEEGWLVKPGDIEALAQGAVECMERAEEYGEAAKERAKDYQWERLVGQVYEVYEAALEEKHREQRSPKVVVVVPNYNYERFLPEALDSIQAQTFRDFECVVVDDGSKVDPEPFIKKHLEDSRFRLLKQENAGVSAARNAGIADSASKYIMCLDADDVLEDDALARLVPALDADEGLGISYGQMRFWREGRPLVPVKNWPKDYDLEALKRGNLVPTCCLFRRKAWEAAGGYPPDPDVEDWGWEDYEYWLTMGSRGWFGKFTRHPTFRYRQHGASRISGAIRQVSGFQSLIRQRQPRLYGPPDARPIGTYDYKGRNRTKLQEAPRRYGKRLVRYTGNRKGATTFRGPATGSTYRFSTSKRENWVDDQDVPHLKHPQLVVGEEFPVRVTVVIPCYNHAEYLPEALDSALGQDYAHVEIVVVDDGSEDDIDAVLIQYKGLDNVRFVRQENKGLAAARNLGISAAGDGFILPLDADDLLAPNAVSRMMAVMDRHGPKTVAYSDFWMFGATPKVGSVYKMDEYDFDKLLNKNLMSATSLFPREAWVQSGGYKDIFSTLGGWEDYELWINFGKRGFCGVRIPEALWGYRQHKESMRKEALRNKKMIQSEIMAIHADIYGGGERPMGCCGGKKQRRGSNPSAINRTVRRPGMDSRGLNPTAPIGRRGIGTAPLVEVEYTGRKKGSFSVRGKATGAWYKFSAKAPLKYMDERDVNAGLGAHFQVVLRVPAEEAVAEVKAQPVPAPAPVPAPPPAPVPVPEMAARSSPVSPRADFSKLKGVGAATDKLLHGLGIHTIEDLAYADPQEIIAGVRVPGDKAEKVARWQEQAAALLEELGDPFVR